MKKQFTIFLILIFILGLAPVNFSNAQNLSNRLSGKILLQVESVGQAWYIDPETKERAFLGRPADAFRIMRELGLGISEDNYNSFNGYAPSRLSGKILLRVEANGEAYYVFPDDLKMHYLGRPADAFKIMRELGLGISNNDLDQISISSSSIDKIADSQTNVPDNKNVSQPNTLEYTLNDIKKGVGHIMCYGENGGLYVDAEGSASVWNFGSGFENVILTNDHVITTKSCSVAVDGGLIHFLDLNRTYEYNSYSDATIVKIDDVRENFFKMSSLDKCSIKMDIGTEIYVIGFPAFAAKPYEELPGIMGEHMPVLTVTEGIISAHDIYVDNFPYINYYVSAKIDSGNSGGISIAQTDNGYCVLGIPTWLTIGNYETQGIIQNIHNIFFESKTQPETQPEVQSSEVQPNVESNPCSNIICSTGQYCNGGYCYNYCQGTDESCGSNSCSNCNFSDGCYGDSYLDYYCLNNSCSYVTDNCSDCSCTCGSYNIEESTNNQNCFDGKDNDCDGAIDSADLQCTQTEKATNALNSVRNLMSDYNNQLNTLNNQMEEKLIEIENTRNQSIPQSVIDAQLSILTSEYNSLVNQYNALLEPYNELTIFEGKLIDYINNGVILSSLDKAQLWSLGIDMY